MDDFREYIGMHDFIDRGIDKNASDNQPYHKY